MTDGMTESLGLLLTEQIDERYAQLDTASVEQLAMLMNEADATVPAAVRAAFPQILPAIAAVSDRIRKGGRLFYVGAGGRAVCVLTRRVPRPLRRPNCTATCGGGAARNMRARN